MSDYFAQAPLGELCDVLDKKRKPITKRDRKPGPYPYYGATGVLDHVENYLFDEPLVLVGEDGAKWGAGENTAYAISGKTWVNNHAHVLRPKREKILDSWLIYYLNALDITKFITGLTVPKLNQGKLREIPVPTPSITEQKRIVAILDEAFAGIETAIANTEKNIANARELFESYLNSVFVQKRATWESSTLGDVYDVRDGTHDSPKYQPSGRALVTSKNLKSGSLDLSNVKYISEEDYQSICRRSAVDKGDVLFAMIGTIGNPVVIENQPDYAIKNVALFKIPRERNGHFLRYYLMSDWVVRKMDHEAKGTTQRFVGLGYLRNFPINIPNLNEEKSLIDKISEYEAISQKLELIYQRKLISLNELKQSLLQKAFSGELTAKKVDDEEQEAVA